MVYIGWPNQTSAELPTRVNNLYYYPYPGSPEPHKLYRYELYCPYKNQGIEINATCFLDAILQQWHLFDRFQSDFEVHDVIFIRNCHNPVFTLHEVRKHREYISPFVQKTPTRIHMNHISRWLKSQEEAI